MREAKSKAATIEPLEQRRLLAAHVFADLTANGLFPTNMMPFNGQVVFSTTQSPNSIWVSDGTTSGTHALLKKLPQQLKAALLWPVFASGKYVYFTALQQDPSVKSGLWRTDGTSAGTLFIEPTSDPVDVGDPYGGDSYTSDADPDLGFSNFTAAGKDVIFSSGGEVYREHPKGGTPVEIDLLNGTTTDVASAENTSYLASKPLNGNTDNLYKIDPGAGTETPTGFAPAAIFDIASVNDTIFIDAAASKGHTLWKHVNGATTFTSLGHFADLQLISQTSTASNVLWFIAQNLTGPRIWQLWRADSTGLHQVTHFTTEAGLAHTSRFTIESNSIEFSANKLDLWQCENTGTSALKTTSFPLPAPKATGAIITAIDCTSQASFVKLSFEKSAQLWRIPQGKTPQSLGDMSYEGELIASANRVFLAKHNPMGYDELWSTDVSSPLRQLSSTWGGTGNSGMANLTSLNGGLLFTTDQRSLPISRINLSLWYTDGSTKPQLIETFQRKPVPYSGFQPAVISAGAYALFTNCNNTDASATKAPIELWRTDGSFKGTFRIKSLPSDMQALRFFGQLGSATIFGSEVEKLHSTSFVLWTTDGTAAGTKPLKTIDLSESSNLKPSSAVVKGTLYITVDGNLIATDGTANGTFDATAKLETGAGASLLWSGQVLAANGKLYIDGELSAPFSKSAAVWSWDPGSPAPVQLFTLPNGQRIQSLFQLPGTHRILAQLDRYSIFVGYDYQLYQVPDRPITDPIPVLPDIEGSTTFVGAAGGYYYFDTFDSTSDDETSYRVNADFTEVTPMSGFSGADVSATVGDTVLAVEYNTLYSFHGLQVSLVENSPVDESSYIDDELAAPDFVTLGNRAFFIWGDTNKNAYLFDYEFTPSIAGTLFTDSNGDGRRENNEPLLAGQTVYVALNNNGTEDGNQIEATTDESGEFAFNDLAPGTYDLVVGSNSSSFTPVTYLLKVIAGQTVTGAFGAVPL